MVAGLVGVIRVICEHKTQLSRSYTIFILNQTIFNHFTIIKRVEFTNYNKERVQATDLTLAADYTIRNDPTRSVASIQISGKNCLPLQSKDGASTPFEAHPLL